MIRTTNNALEWQSKAVLLIVVPWTVASVVLQAHWWATQVPVVAWTALGVSSIFGLVVWRLKAATPGGAMTGAAITASLMFATVRFPYQWSWLHSGLMPLLMVFLLTFVATKMGKAKKEQIGTGEGKRGRNAAQVAANLGMAALVANLAGILFPEQNSGAIFAIAALAEAAADTVSSEIGQVFGGAPRMLTTLRRVAPGTDGGVTVVGTCAGAAAAVLVAVIGVFLLYDQLGLMQRWVLCAVLAAAGVFGLLFDSLLGALFERKGWLNNDAVNFLSTISAVVFAVFAALALVPLMHG